MSAQFAPTRMEEGELPLATGNSNQEANAHMNTTFSSDMSAGRNTHERFRYSGQRKMVDPVDSYPGQQCLPANSELSELIDLYIFENLYWEQLGCGNDVLDNPSWSTAPTPRLDAFIAQTAPPDTPIAEQRTDDQKNEAEDKEQRRIQQIVKDLEKFETQQKEYGQQQLKAIKNGSA